MTLTLSVNINEQYRQDYVQVKAAQISNKSYFILHLAKVRQ